MEGAPARGEGGERDRGPRPGDEAKPEEVQAWEQIEAGRYMPRRIRGSCRGRTLG
jgi:hypothetical protein